MTRDRPVTGSRWRAWVWGVILCSFMVGKLMLQPMGHEAPTLMAILPGWLMAVGCGALVLLAAVFISRGKRCARIRSRLSRPSVHGDAYLEAFALRLLAMAVLSSAIRLITWGPDSFWVLDALTSPGASRLPSFIAIAWVVVRARSLRLPLAESGWRRGRGVTRELLIGTFAAALAWPICNLAHSLAPIGSDVLDVYGDSALVIADIVVWTPVIEETFYRGFLYRHLRDRLQWLPAVVISAVIFALMHRVTGMPYALASGLTYGVLREWRQSLIAPLAAHASWNLLSIAKAGI